MIDHAVPCRVQVLKTIAEYPTETTVCLITNQPAFLANTLWEFPNVDICGNTQNLSHPHHLAWVHREVMEAAYNKGGKASSRPGTHKCLRHSHCIAVRNSWHVKRLLPLQPSDNAAVRLSVSTPLQDALPCAHGTIQ